MNVYDFDGTIYDGDSTIDFYFFCLKYNRKVLKALPVQILGAVKYGFGRIGKTEFKEHFYTFLNHVENTDALLAVFWSSNIKKIKPCYLKKQNETDVIISASPYFLLKPVCDRLCIKYLIASDVDRYTGKCNGLNCRGREKLRRFKKEFGLETIDEFYSDNKSDWPLASCAKKSYLISGGKCNDWNNQK